MDFWICSESLCSFTAEALQWGERGNVDEFVGVVSSVLITEKGLWKMLAVLPKSQESCMFLPMCISCHTFHYRPFAGHCSLAQPLCCGMFYSELRLQEDHT